MAELTVDRVSKVWQTERGTSVRALSDVSLSVGKNEFVALIGRSGCGKTTLLNIIAGLEHPTEGAALFDGREIDGPSRDIGVVFQADALFMWRTVRRNVEYGLEVQGIPRAERRSIAERYLELVGLLEFQDLYPKELSGGMRKRCQIATVLANDPGVLLMDEPFGALDYATKNELQAELLHILNVTPKTTVFVTHDVEEALLLADRIAVMANGEIAAMVDVPFERPREESLRLTDEFAHFKADLWERLQHGHKAESSRGARGYGDGDVQVH